MVQEIGGCGPMLRDLKKVTDPEKISLEYHHEPVLKYQFLVDRFKDEINPAVFNLSRKEIALIGEEHERCNYIAIDMKGMYTEKELSYNQQWIARYNMAVAIQQKVDEEYKKNHEAIIKEIKDLINKNLRELVKKHMKG